VKTNALVEYKGVDEEKIRRTNPRFSGESQGPWRGEGSSGGTDRVTTRHKSGKGLKRPFHREYHGRGAKQYNCVVEGAFG